ncbi:MAG: PTS lactose/cellobiose transporter subunit IIA [Liquorilactobacillus hordei]|mgnify:CR=1 FL=1|jgi:PTS system cellobiose-specific IIA component|uniref:PTS system, cellobiose-specific IIA component n=1 Tax=Liquorilactobacillus cacaonum DSM 21116 TaxID=1423729 RepID=A0A0R2CQC3_9LACO|nr:PTS lactose/cellobiose transporter subunit IIA [Liquorilactobacillus cacaonum]KRM91988.1 PTS system, cellobiose-specific IIA component [Liquorilactobacillus cacaonum DSM 21116]
MDEKQLEKAMQLISIAGNAKSLCIQAMSLAEKNDFKSADDMLEEAKKVLHEAHNVQTAWMTAEMNGEKVEKSILLIHSQDHFISADMMLTVAQKVITLNKKVAELSKIK